MLVVVPAYNEARRLGSVLAELDHRVLVVDDGSTDSTRHIALNYGAEVVSHPVRAGYGASLLTGFAWARRAGHALVATLDADGQHDPGELDHLFLAMRVGVDVASGTRFSPASRQRGLPPPPDRLDINRRITERINRDTGWQLTDAFCGMKAYRLAALERLPLDRPDYGFSVQFWAQAHRAGLRIVEVPVSCIYLPQDVPRDWMPDPERRLDYYLSVWEHECSMPLR